MGFSVGMEFTHLFTERGGEEIGSGGGPLPELLSKDKDKNKRNQNS